MLLPRAREERGRMTLTAVAEQGVSKCEKAEEGVCTGVVVAVDLWPQ